VHALSRLTNWNDVKPDAKEAVEGAPEGMVVPMKVCPCHHSDPHSIHPSVPPDPAQVKQELEWVSSCADPSRLELGLAFPHTTVLIGPKFHGTHCEED